MSRLIDLHRLLAKPLPVLLVKRSRDISALRKPVGQDNTNDQYRVVDLLKGRCAMPFPFKTLLKEFQKVQGIVFGLDVCSTLSRVFELTMRA
jgi:hypothetical protein